MQRTLGCVTYHNHDYNENKGGGETKTADQVVVDSEPRNRTTWRFHDICRCVAIWTHEMCSKGI